MDPLSGFQIATARKFPWKPHSWKIKCAMENTGYTFYNVQNLCLWACRAGQKARDRVGWSYSGELKGYNDLQKLLALRLPLSEGSWISPSHHAMLLAYTGSMSASFDACTVVPLRL